MRFLTLFIVLNIFLCHTSISSTLNSFVAEEESEVPSCHIISGNDISNAHTEKVAEDNFSLPQNELFSSCCLLSLINTKDLDCNFQYDLFSVDISSYLEVIFFNDTKIRPPLFKVGHSPPDLIIQKSSFLI